MNNQKGFVALISIIIIMSVLLVISVSLSLTSFNTRFNVGDAEYKKKSSALAEACLDAQLLKLAQGVIIIYPATVSVGSDSCTIISKQDNVPTSGQSTIKTKAVFQQSITNLEFVVNSSNFSLINWQELPNL